jgi:hypothetical protein
MAHPYKAPVRHADTISQFGFDEGEAEQVVTAPKAADAAQVASGAR